MELVFCFFQGKQVLNFIFLQPYEGKENYLNCPKAP